MSSRARTRLDPEVRREQIIDATELVLADHDPGDITLEQIAEAAGVSRGLVYNYFGDKAGLLASVYLRNLDRLVAALELPLRAAPTVEQRLREVVEVYLRFASENPAGWRLLSASEASEHPAVRGARREHLERISTSWGETPEARVLGRGILGFLEAATIEWIDESDLDVEQTADLIHAQLWSGLGLSTTRQQYQAATLR
jgi:AcrR family transcriptional regulator